MIKGKILLQVHASNSAASSLDKWLYVDFEMPFSPVMGMTLSINEEIQVELVDRPRYEGGCCHIVYEVKSQELKIYIEDMPRDHSKIKEIVRDYKKQGWKTYR